MDYQSTEWAYNFKGNDFMETINDLSVQEKVLQRIRDAILDGKFAPGMPLRIDTLAA